MTNFWNIVWGVVILLLLGSAFFDFIPWTFNFIALGIVVVLWGVSLYNGFVTMRNRVDEAWADIDVQLKRRYDLIPNLVETVKGYASHERAAFDSVTEARAKATSVHVDPSAITPEALAAMAGAEAVLTQSLGRLLAVAENYPTLKADTNFLELQRELSDTENKIQAARRFYNSNVRDFNTAVQVFPSNIIANIFSFTARDFFELDEAQQAAREPVAVKF